jgi:ATP-binding cassette subfamily B multidrug efflux pump
MFLKLFEWFETRLDAFAARPVTPVPTKLAAFYLYYLKPIWPVFLALLAAGLAGALIEVWLMAFIGDLIDRMRAANEPKTFIADHAWLLIGMALVALVVRPVVSTLHDLVKNQMISAPVSTRIRYQQHTHVLRQSIGFFQNDFAGRVANKVMQNGPAIRESVVALVDSLWYAAVHFLGALALFWAADWRLAVPLVIWVAAYAWALSIFVPRIQKLSADAAEARSTLTGRIVDSYTNMLTVKLFAHTAREEEAARDAMAHQFAAYKASVRNLTTMELVIFALNGVLMVATTGLALWLWSANEVTIGAIAVVTGLVLRLVAMSGWIFWVVAGIFENIGTVAEGIEAIAKAPDVVDAAGAQDLVVTKGEIRFEDVRFHYGKTKGVIDELSLTIAPGEKVGLVGRSGAGKSTVVNLLLRFFDVERGRILIDGQDIARVRQDSLRSQIGLVTQDTSLLHRSVLDNILYGRPEAGLAGAISAAKKAQAHEFIMGLEDGKGRKGYEALVGERGVKLSGGQRQRIAIARVLLKDAPILILDEATSALDSEVEAAIQEQLFNLMTGKTVIAIAHRLSTIAALDRLVIMDQGRIAEQGSHADLLRRGGLYADLWERQSGGFVGRAAAE